MTVDHLSYLQLVSVGGFFGSQGESQRLRLLRSYKVARSHSASLLAFDPHGNVRGLWRAHPMVFLEKSIPFMTSCVLSSVYKVSLSSLYTIPSEFALSIHPSAYKSPVIFFTFGVT